MHIFLQLDDLASKSTGEAIRSFRPFLLLPQAQALAPTASRVHLLLTSYSSSSSPPFSLDDHRSRSPSSQANHPALPLLDPPEPLDHSLLSPD